MISRLPLFLAVFAAGFATGAAAQTIPEQTVGQHFDIRADAMPPPHATEAVSNPPEEIARPPGATLHVLAGFSASIFADGLTHPRWMTVAPNGDVFLAESDAGKITLLRDADGDGKAEFKTTFANGFTRPHGLAVRNGALYVADTRAVWRIPYVDGTTQGTGRTAVTREGVFDGDEDHWTRNLVFDSRGRMFVAVGSSANVTEDPSPRATAQLFDENGKQSTFASGMRNPVGIAFYPGSNDLYVVVNERDDLGDGLVPDYLTRVEPGAFYGWPYAYIGKHPDPDFGKKRPDMVAKSVAPDLLFQAHSAPLGLVFYEGNQFPASYKGDAFVALHGSWNSSKPTGYKIVHVPFRNGRPAGGYDNFAVGFWSQGKDRAQVWGRPVGLAVAKDGSLLIADDTGKAVWRIAYTGKGK